MKANRYRLRPLRIPAGWSVTWNAFYDYEPSALPEDETGVLADLLQMVSDRRGLLIDLGWSGDPRQYRILLLRRIEPSSLQKWNWDRPLKEFETRSTAEAAAKIDDWLEEHAEA